MSYLIDGIGERIRRIAESHEQGVDDFAKQTYSSRSQLRRYMQEESEPKASKLAWMSKVGNVSVDYITLGANAVMTGVAHVPIDDFNNLNDPEFSLFFPTDSQPEELAMFKVEGDAMTPELRNGETVVARRLYEVPTKEGMFVVRIQDSIVVRHIQLLPDGAINLVAYNHKTFPPIKISPDSLNEKIQFIGPVVWRGGYI